MRYSFVQDDNCHWYMVEADQVDAFEVWAVDGEEDDYDGPDFSGDMLGGGISMWSFTDPKYDAN